MPELPEVETVRSGLAHYVLGRAIATIQVYRDYSIRRHEGGSSSLVHQLSGVQFQAAVRRGKFLWLPLSSDAGVASSSALMVHLGMSGQLLVRSAVTNGPHVRARIIFDDGGLLDFVDQRTFGHLSVQPLIPTEDGGPGGYGAPMPLLPALAVRIARDLLDQSLDLGRLVRELAGRKTSIKRALLNQHLVSGVGNIYADEALWRAGIHGDRPCRDLADHDILRVLDAARAVMTQALAQGGTSFDSLYVNVNGSSGYFSRSLQVYGQAGQPCSRCGSTIMRSAFANRSSFWCPECQQR